MPIYSVKLLKESIHSPKISEGLCFEESIVLIRADSEDKLKKGALLNLIKGNLGDEPYLNEYGETITWKVIDVLDIFEMNDDIEGYIDFVEVYSRYLPFDYSISAEEVIKKYNLK